MDQVHRNVRGIGRAGACRYRIPSYGEVGWLLPEGLFTYWKGEVTPYEPQ